MSLDPETVRTIAALARLRVAVDQLEPLGKELSAIIGFVEQLQGVDTADVAPMTSVIDLLLPERNDEVTDGNCRDGVLANAPERIDCFYAVPKVVE
ncbi:MAG: Asp-tRNA(Asn)/Glu-tRNA(Gln) amidotransferase subunit GatC [Defluviicoccus sp.]|nr:Asp-tRNA(Asn)/Glu-tRNA(Gln) amidotransferase subunit GatC [Defluviicoccus sp.]MDG4591005.1 Asp-tRNA(Asn)/Glu-tRNA(Gln) amidotransferase subunit GatC [Defluviicoccus sp.]MDS4073237.1 Asp-tRNA(Asn)/Glu-tRNA(Gln) amidotransferase subunit GatC [Defluviicoccus sp.]